MLRLWNHLDAVTMAGQARLLSIRGGRQEGQSRLVTEFAGSRRLPSCSSPGHGLRAPAMNFSRLASEAARSSLPSAAVFDEVTPDGGGGRAAADRVRAAGRTAIVMLDEFPWLCQSSPEIEGRAPGRLEPDLRTEPVLFILIGSDIAMMEALSTYEHPLFGRVKAMVVNPFDLGDTAEMMAGTDPAVAIDAQLVTGGYPRLCAEGCAAPDVNAFFERQLADENSDLVDVPGASDAALIAVSRAGCTRQSAPVEDFIVRLVIARLSRPDAADLLDVTEGAPDVTALREEAAAIGRNLEEMAADRALGLIDRAQMLAATGRANGRLAEIGAELDSAARENVLAPLVAAENAAAAWEDLDLAVKRAVIRTLMTITLHSPGRGTPHLRPRYGHRGLAAAGLSPCQVR